MTINRALEEKLIELRQHLDLEKGKRPVHSPDTSSCHEVHVTTTAGFSPHSSPLSASLASSEGSTTVHEREIKNLQVNYLLLILLFVVLLNAVNKLEKNEIYTSLL